MIDRAAALKIASAIQVQEGWFPDSLSYRNNNPGNLRYVGQTGAVPGEGGFAKFPTYEAGLAATVSQIELNASRGHDAAGRTVATVQDLIYSWAPPNENDSAAYVASIEQQTGFSARDLLSSLGIASDTAGGEGEQLAGSGISALSFAAIGLGASALYWLAFHR